MLDNFFEEWYRITKLKISNFFEWFFHKLRGKEVMNWVIVKSVGGNYLCRWKLFVVTSTNHYHLRRR